MRTMDEALRLIIARSPSQAHEAAKALRAPEATRQMRYNAIATYALADAEYTAEERALIAEYIVSIDEETRARQLPAVRVTEAEHAEIADAAEAAGMTVSGYIRSRLLA